MLNLEKLGAKFSRTFSRNNAIFINGLSERIGFLLLAVADLQDVIRKKAPQQVVSIALARVVSFTYCVADYFDGLSVAHAMCQKYSLVCGFCNRKPCACPPGERPAHNASGIDPRQLAWNIRKWQEHLEAMYGEKNRRTGIDNAILRLFKECTELLLVQMGITHVNSTAAEIETEFGLEIADVLAWCMAVATLVEVDLQEAVLDLYGRGCPTCNGEVCRCTRFISVGRKGWRRPAPSGEIRRTVAATTLAIPPNS